MARIIYINLKNGIILRIEKNTELINDIKSAGIILKPSSPELKETYLNIKKLFEEADIEIFLENNSAILLKEELYHEIMQFFPYNSMPKGYEIFEKLTFDFLNNFHCLIYIFCLISQVNY